MFIVFYEWNLSILSNFCRLQEFTAKEILIFGLLLMDPISSKVWITWWGNYGIRWVKIWRSILPCISDINLNPVLILRITCIFQTRVKIVCKVLSLPFPSDVSNPGGEDVANKTDEVNLKILDRKRIAKFLLVGGDRSGTSTIFKQVARCWIIFSSFWLKLLIWKTMKCICWSFKQSKKNILLVVYWGINSICNKQYFHSSFLI